MLQFFTVYLVHFNSWHVNFYGMLKKKRYLNSNEKYFNDTFELFFAHIVRTIMTVYNFMQYHWGKEG